MNMHGYRCIACSAIQAQNYDGFLCPVCDGNLDVIYDYHAVAKDIDDNFSKGPNNISRFAPLLPLKQRRYPLH